MYSAVFKAAMVRIFLLPLITLVMGLLLGQGQLELNSDIDHITYPEHLTGAFTGGFGEQTCRSCHFDYDLNPEDGSLQVSGIPEEISGGERMEISITVKRENLGRAGFQISSRFEDGSQAGQFEAEGNDRIMFSKSVPDSLQYLQHSKTGSEPSDPNQNTWEITWKAPDKANRKIVFNIAANAANGDQSEFGDYIFAEEVAVVF